MFYLQVSSSVITACEHSIYEPWSKSMLIALSDNRNRNICNRKQLYCECGCIKTVRTITECRTSVNDSITWEVKMKKDFGSWPSHFWANCKNVNLKITVSLWSQWVSLYTWVPLLRSRSRTHLPILSVFRVLSNKHL